MVKYNELLGPEKVIVDRLCREEPLLIINAWLEYSGFKPITDENLKSLSLRYHDIVVEERAKLGDDSVLSELKLIKDKLMTTSSGDLAPKDLAYVSNSINMLSKTINDYVDKNKAKDDTQSVDVLEFMRVMDFLESENLLKFNKGKKDELRKKLLETVSEE